MEKSGFNGRISAYMVRFCTIIIALVFICAARIEAAVSEQASFQAASEALRDKFYERAEEQFGAFTAAFPASTNFSRAVLFQAQARHFQKKHDGSIELLKNHFAKAGTLGDGYLLWWGDALAAKGEHQGAAEIYGRLLLEFPASALRLQAAYLQALSVYNQRDFTRAVDLLGNSEGAFRKLADATPGSRFSFAGRVLLVDALLAAGKTQEASAAAAAIPAETGNAEWQWERFDALARAELAGTNTTAALGYLSNAVTAAQSAQKIRLQAQSWNLEAELYRKLGQPSNAILSYEKIAAAEGLPIDQKRLAVLKTVELLSGSGNVTNAIRRLETYLGANTNEPAADLLKVKAGELWIDQARTAGAVAGTTGAKMPEVTNALAQARMHLNGVLTQFTNSTYTGRAWLNLGWALWEEGTLLNERGRVQESEDAFRTASEKLTRSDDQALSIFKTADAQLFLGQPRGAITNYTRVLKDFADLPQVKNALFDRTHAQLVRAYVAIGDLQNAEITLEQLRSGFKNNPLTEEAIVFFGQSLIAAGSAGKARTLFQEFLSEYPTSVLAGEARFAEARTYGVEGDFAMAAQKHQEWLQRFTNHQLRAAVEFQRGVLLDRLGQGTNALTVFTNFVAQYPVHSLTAAAQTWVADHYYALEEWLRAEQNYQRVFQNTNWAGSSLAYYSRMMAARTAFQRPSYNDARSYLTNLVNDPKCPSDIKAEAWFALGDIFLEEPITGSTNALHNFMQAAAVFDRIVAQYPTNEIALLATAKRGDCYFQIASHTNYFESYLVASNAYATVLKSPLKLPAKVRNQAEFGMGRVLERMGDRVTENDRSQLRKTALNHYLNVVYGDGTKTEEPDPFYLKLAGREAARLAEELGNKGAAIELYKRLCAIVPASRPLWESRIAALQDASESQPAL